MMFQRMNLVVLAALAAMVGCSADDSATESSAPLEQKVVDAGAPKDAGMSAKADASAKVTTAVSGTATKAACLSYSEGEPDSGMCNGYYCGVTEAQIAQSIPANPVCGLSAGDLCKGTLTDAVAGCTRQVVVAHLGEPIEPLRPLIHDCVFEDAAIKAKVNEGCLGCFLNVAICAASNCLVECLADSPNCDSCRRKANCEQPVFGCGGLPDPL